MSKQRGFDFLRGTRRSTEGELFSLTVQLVKGRQAVRPAGQRADPRTLPNLHRNEFRAFSFSFSLPG